MVKKLRKVSDYADLMSIETFEGCADCGAFIPYDGDGHFAREINGVFYEDPNSDVWSAIGADKHFTHVAWYNR